jgi:hypothetical protein
MYKKMERSTIKHNRSSYSAYDSDFLDLFDLVEKEPALDIDSSPSSFSFSSEPLPLSLNATNSDVWSPLRVTSGNKGPQSPCESGQLSSAPCFDPFSRSKLLSIGYVDSTYGSRASSDAPSIDGSSCPRESARSPIVTSSRLSWVEERARLSDYLLRFNLGVNGDKYESLACGLCPWVGHTPSEKRSASLPLYGSILLTWNTENTTHGTKRSMDVKFATQVSGPRMI